MMLNCPRFERPREKAICNGIETLSNQELIAVILRTGNKEMSVLNLASLLLEEIGGIAASYDNFDKEQIEKNPFRMPDEKAAALVEEYAMKQIEQGDSIGGIIECVIDGMMPGIGEPVFDKLDAKLAQAVFSIGAVKGFEIGSGFNAARLTGTENNDAFYMNNGKVEKKTNNAGGILGGMSDGSQIVFRTAIKPTPSISSVQDTVNKDGE